MDIFQIILLPDRIICKCRTQISVDYEKIVSILNIEKGKRSLLLFIMNDSLTCYKLYLFCKQYATGEIERQLVNVQQSFIRAGKNCTHGSSIPYKRKKND